MANERRPPRRIERGQHGKSIGLGSDEKQHYRLHGKQERAIGYSDATAMLVVAHCDSGAAAGALGRRR